MIIIGEKINSSIKSVVEQMENKNENFIKDLALKQVEAGADYLDINAGTFADEEVQMLSWLLNVVTSVTKSPLMIDSPSPKVIEQVLPLCKDRKIIINSATFEKSRFDGMVNLAKKYDTSIVALPVKQETRDESSIKDKIESAALLVDMILKTGIPTHKIYLDPMIMPIATEAASVTNVLKIAWELKKIYPDIHLICGLSNVSFGLPKRRILNRAFLSMAMVAGIDAPIVDPLDKKLMSLLHAAKVLLGKDEYCMDYLTKFREDLLED